MHGCSFQGVEAVDTMLETGYHLPLATTHDKDTKVLHVTHSDLCPSPASLIAPWVPVHIGLIPHVSHVPAQPAFVWCSFHLDHCCVTLSQQFLSDL